MVQPEGLCCSNTSNIYITLVLLPIATVVYCLQQSERCKFAPSFGAVVEVRSIDPVIRTVAVPVPVAVVLFVLVVRLRKQQQQQQQQQSDRD